MIGIGFIKGILDCSSCDRKSVEFQILKFVFGNKSTFIFDLFSFRSVIWDSEHEFIEGITDESHRSLFYYYHTRNTEYLNWNNQMRLFWFIEVIW